MGISYGNQEPQPGHTRGGATNLPLYIDPLDQYKPAPATHETRRVMCLRNLPALV